MRAPPSIIAIAALLAACSPPPHAGQTAQPIINGSSCPATVDPSAVAVVYTGTYSQPFGGSMPFTMLGCVGTLIAPDVVLTAGHCVHIDKSAPAQIQITSEKYMISFTADLSYLVQSSAGGPGPAPSPPSDAVAAAAQTSHPQFDVAKFSDSSQPPKGLGNYYDVGLIFLAQPVLNVQPAVVITAAEAAQIKAQGKVRIVGWGQTSPQRNPMMPGASGGGTRTCAESVINQLGTSEMQIGSDTQSPHKCHGDSGGPSYLEVQSPSARKQRVVGITSRAYDPQADCYLGGVDTRVDAHLGWIDQELRKRCDSGQRAWCKVKGLIPPGYYDPPKSVTPDLGVPVPPPSDSGPVLFDDSGSVVGGDQGGGGTGNGVTEAGASSEGGCSVASRRRPGWPLALLLALLLALRRG
jgi:hypothetical protein